jgi:hypothetical protein
MPVYYNEIEPYPAQWLRNLIKAGRIPDGEVDERYLAALFEVNQGRVAEAVKAVMAAVSDDEGEEGTE